MVKNNLKDGFDNGFSDSDNGIKDGFDDEISESLGDELKDCL